ncbi:TIGR03943 family protein [Nocardioides carbamazepini]|uniref:TIGR03943 family putative permease subunit n=1 Tax=Nocardioides carbamazepini TaxID=2854259 RepID=UPI002149F26F|nr:TIGR03943 family protein [Nocardioides carbamazepini]MCR1783477.1 TIGR03943 family protein [Nocardioides carbamazepini]
MNRNAQAVVLAAIGAVALRVGITDEYARYVNDWMRWPLVVSGGAMVALAFLAVFSRDHDDSEASSAVWAMLLPVVIAFVVQPPALGAYVAERRSNDVSAVQYDRAAVAPLPAGRVSDLLVSEFVAYASVYGEVLAGAQVRLRGFVTHDEDGWYVTRLSISCCAADALAFRVRVDGADGVDGSAPGDEEWVEVVGTWVEGTGEGVGAEDAPVLTATEITPTDPPKRPYE